MFVGACAGSTGGGMKVSRHLVLFKGAKHELRRMIQPKQIKKITLDGKVVEHEVVRSINAYLVAVFMIIVSINLLTWLAHAKNLQRLFSGEERHTSIRKLAKKK
jgi:trk system potassium uptake protein TrkH